MLILLLSGCGKVIPTTLNLYNASDSSVDLIVISGISLYSKRTGPQSNDYGCPMQPNFLTSITSWQTAEIHYPIEVIWTDIDTAKVHTNHFTKISGLFPESLKNGGNIILVYEGNKTWSLSYLEDHISPSRQELERKYRDMN